MLCIRRNISLPGCHADVRPTQKRSLSAANIPGQHSLRTGLPPRHGTSRPARAAHVACSAAAEAAPCPLPGAAATAATARAPPPPLLRALAAAACAAVALALLPPAALAAGKAAAAAAPAASGGVVGAVKGALSFALHLDVHLGELVARFGTATYAVLFAIVFAETGLVVTPFLPGDSLLFATGALAALGKLSLPALLAVYIAAAILGDAANYAVGNYFGSRALQSRLVKREYVARTEEFYATHGGKTVVLARFVPIVRTFAPFVAGVGSMPYAKFGLYNVVGAVLWTAVCTGAGYLFGNVPAVQENFSLVVLGIVAVSLLPILFELVAAKVGSSSGGSPGRPGAVQRDGGSLRAGFN